LAHIGPVYYIILIKCYKFCEEKSNLWLQCDELTKGESVSRVKVCQCHLVNKILKKVYEKCRVHSEGNYSHHSKVLAMFELIIKFHDTEL